MYVNALLEGNFSILIDEYLANEGEVLSQLDSEAGSNLTVAEDEALEGLEEGIKVEVSWLLIGLLFLIKTALFLELGKCGTSLLGFLLLSECALFSSGKTVVVVLAPIWEVTVALHVALRETEDLKGLQKELFLAEHIAD